MKKQIFHDAATGVLIGLILSILFHSFMHQIPMPHWVPSLLSAKWWFNIRFTVSLVLLYCMVIWSAIGVLFSFWQPLIQPWRSLLRATLSHFFLMLAGFCSTSNSWLVGSPSTGPSIPAHSRVCDRPPSSAISIKRRSGPHQSTLAHKK